MRCNLCETSTACPVHDPEMYPHPFIRTAARYDSCRVDGCGKSLKDPIHRIPIDPTVFVYGWGRTKHIKDPGISYPVGLCGASGGNQFAEKRGDRMPVCQHCQRQWAADQPE